MVYFIWRNKISLMVQQKPCFITQHGNICSSRGQCLSTSTPSRKEEGTDFSLYHSLTRISPTLTLLLVSTSLQDTRSTQQPWGRSRGRHGHAVALLTSHNPRAAVGSQLAPNPSTPNEAKSKCFLEQGTLKKQAFISEQKTHLLPFAVCRNTGLPICSP